ncbi:MAG: hypothetical protein AVDCRST_MAG01-01-1423 [uncultured Rubrobacteraceae bacterium]|uniref:Enoyl reductase (ER) domain-containing protein n=1 Tax=uncultured Rubrobacteraceae bacterium TaxID=349277 RepID=A0A6J4PED1_9ACTN|nr:MAG: hypothetical protein AVDCRST_MAG01-01-1423 [uncultured Rubrobacteraceae bacterium]
MSAGEGDTLVVSGAAGGVGSIAVQLAKNAGTEVIGLASGANHEWLRSHGVIPIVYGEGQADRIGEASGGEANAFIDTFGSGYVELALNLGVRPERIDTIIDFAAVENYGGAREVNRGVQRPVPPSPRGTPRRQALPCRGARGT